MTESRKDEHFERLVQKIDPRARLLRAWELKGGVSAQVTALEIERPDGLTTKLVVRRYGQADLERNPRVAADEFKLLQILQSAEVAAPRPVYLDRAGEILTTPAVAIEYVQGTTEFAPSSVPDLLLQFAAQLSRIHAVDGSKFDLSFLPKQEDAVAKKLRERPVTLDDSLDEGRLRRALESVWPLPRRNSPVLLHGDFWPGNILWNDGRLVAVIDWEDAALGDPLADVANSRLEILWAFGSGAMHRFTHHYRSLTAIDFTDLPYWDLWAALRPAGRIGEWAANETTERGMRAGHKAFVAQAFYTLSARRTT